MKITMYGAAICPECVHAKAILEKRANIELDYINITESTRTLRAFLSHRDRDELFAEVLQRGSIGIPFFIIEDGTKTFDVFDYLDVQRPELADNVCSIDGKGQC